MNGSVKPSRMGGAFRSRFRWPRHLHEAILIALSVVLASCVAPDDPAETGAATQSLRCPRGPWQSGSFPAGDGTAADPFAIATCADLQRVDLFPASHFVVIDEIDCSDFDAGDGLGFFPIATGTGFSGVLDGDGHRISGLRAGRPRQNRVGLFGRVQGGTISHIGIVDGAFAGRTRVGTIAGDMRGGTLEQVFATGSVAGHRKIGGLVGAAKNGTLLDSYARVDLTGPDSRQSGTLVGWALGLVARNSYGVDFTALADSTVGRQGPGTDLEAAFHDCDIAGTCDLATAGRATTDQLQDDSFLSDAGWDFDAVWGLRNSMDYPCLRWEGTCGVVDIAIDESLELETTQFYFPEEAERIVRAEFDGGGFEFFLGELDVDIEREEGPGPLLAAEGLEVVLEDLWDGPDPAPDIYLLRTTATTPACDGVADLLRGQTPGIDGTLTFSSEAARQTFCVLLRVLDAGYDADLNEPMKPTSYNVESENITAAEPPTTTRNIYDWRDFVMRNGIPYGIPQAWEALEAHGVTPVRDSPGIVVADRGFARSPDLRYQSLRSVRGGGGGAGLECGPNPDPCAGTRIVAQYRHCLYRPHRERGGQPVPSGPCRIAGEPALGSAEHRRSRRHGHTLRPALRPLGDRQGPWGGQP